jgi:hypothetical protein
MIRLSPFVMPGLAAALALLFVGEWLLPGPGAVPPTSMLAVPAAVSDYATDHLVGQWGDTVLARPLFNPDRRPASEVSTGTGTDLPRLSAIIITGGMRAAVFAADGQKPQVVQAGGTISGYQLLHVTPNSVDMLGPDGTVTLRPQFITAAPTGPAAASASTPGVVPGMVPANNSSNYDEENPN